MERGGAKGRSRKRGRQRLIKEKQRTTTQTYLLWLINLCPHESREWPPSQWSCSSALSRVHSWGPDREHRGAWVLTFSLSRMYVINNEICTRTVCAQDEHMKAELCRERSGWPRRIQRSANQKRRCRSRRGNL
ncbi:unnamed protein product [Knipowitschia caucasica]|uniref:Uncharacterized protein n=1 Tax=Knipowitschia caucasica TaxID=637954 RepID=A0AAV2KD09_KNICA